jgi:hypothetical protein
MAASPSPQIGESATVTEPRSFRINAPRKAEMVEVSVNGGPWLPCRQVGGFWLSDWAGFELWKYNLRARMRTTERGKAKTTLLRLYPGEPPAWVI